MTFFDFFGLILCFCDTLVSGNRENMELKRMHYRAKALGSSTQTNTSLSHTTLYTLFIVVEKCEQQRLNKAQPATARAPATPYFTGSLLNKKYFHTKSYANLQILSTHSAAEVTLPKIKLQSKTNTAVK